MKKRSIEHQGVECQRCEDPFALTLLAVGQSAIGNLPDPFPAWCPGCGYNGSYMKSSVRTYEENLQTRVGQGTLVQMH